MKGLLWVMALLLALGLPVACRATATRTEPGPSTANVTPTPREPSSPTPQKKRVIVVFHPAYLRVYSHESAADPGVELGTSHTWEQVWDVYSSEPAADPGRIAAILEELQGVPDLIFTEPEPASEEDLRSVHTQGHIDSVKLDPQVYEAACLAAGGAILASEMAMAGEVSFGLIRPPGHHASPDSSLGDCYFNNIAVAVKKLLDEKKIERALIVDFDFHFGDGTKSIFDDPENDDPRVTYFHVEGGDRIEQLRKLEEFLSQTEGYDILAVSAGFDGGKEDLGGIFEIQDYTTIGTLLKVAAERNSGGKRFAVLEGGYNQDVLGKNVKAFLDGFR